MAELNLFAARPDQAARIASSSRLARKSTQSELSDAEFSEAIAQYCAQPFARAMDISATDLAQCPFYGALIAYSAYRFLPSLSADKRLALLLKAYNDLLAFCQTSNSAAGLSSLARVAHDFGHRGVVLDVLQRLIDIKHFELDQPFFPTSSRFDLIDAVTADIWFVYSIREILELDSSYSSMFACNMSRLELLATQDSASEEIVRRLVLAKWFGGAPANELEVHFARLHDTGVKDNVTWCETVRSLTASS